MLTVRMSNQTDVESTFILSEKYYRFQYKYNKKNK